MQALDEYENSYVQAYIDLISAYGTTGQMEQAREALA